MIVELDGVNESGTSRVPDEDHHLAVGWIRSGWPTLPKSCLSE